MSPFSKRACIRYYTLLTLFSKENHAYASLGKVRKKTLQQGGEFPTFTSCINFQRVQKVSTRIKVFKEAGSIPRSELPRPASEERRVLRSLFIIVQNGLT